MALVVLLPGALIGRCVIAAIEQKLRQLDVLLPAAVALHVVHKAPKANKRLFHLLMTVVPGLLRRWTDVVAPAIRQFFRSAIHARVFLVGHQVVVDRRLKKVPAV